MEILRIEILNPGVKKLLEDLASLNLIRFKGKDSSLTEFRALIARLRAREDPPLPLDQITKAVEAIRQKRYGS